MAIKLIRTLDDNSTVVKDDADGAEFTLKSGQYARIAVLPEAQQRVQLERYVLENRADPSGGRSQADEQAMDSARDSSSGEAHQDQER